MSKTTKKTEGETLQVLSVYLKDQAFGIPIVNIQDVLKPLQMTQVPLAPDYIAGIANLRGRIVTAINLRSRILGKAVAERDSMNVVIETGGELYSILVDRVGDVLNLDPDSVEAPPLTLDETFRDLIGGVHQLDKSIMIILDTEKVIHEAA
jgi:purine-binding chemotaxis protein CheW